MTEEDPVTTILSTARDSKYLEAERLLNELNEELGSLDVLQYLEEEGEDKARYVLAEVQEGAHEATIDLLLANRASLKEVIHRARQIKQAVNLEREIDWTGDGSSQWKLGAEYLGIETYYKIDDGRITVRMQGGLTDLPLFEQCAVIHEIDLFSEWIPFCNDSALLEKLGPAELLMYLSVSPLFLSRDTCMHTWGADCLNETGQILLFGHSINHTRSEENYQHSTLVEKDWCSSKVKNVRTYSEETACPWKAESWTHKKMEIIDFKAMFKPTSANAARTCLEACVDPKIPLHQALVNFVIKKMAGLALYFFQKRVSEVAHSVDNSTSRKIQQNSTFYTEWLLPKVRHYYDLQRWDMGGLPCLGQLAPKHINPDSHQEDSVQSVCSTHDALPSSSTAS